MSKKPNIVLFVPDSYRGDVLRHQGNQGALTPNLDAVTARGGVSYSNAFAQNPVCTPSRCSFMTGWYPHVYGHRSMRNMLKEHEPNLLSVLRKEGYHVWWGGKNDLVRVQCRSDYLRYCDEKFMPGDIYRAHMEYRQPPVLAEDDPRHGAYYKGVLRRNTDRPLFHDHDLAWTLGAVDMIKNNAKKQPFCCFLPIGRPHPPYLAEDDLYNSIDPEKLPPRIPVPNEDANLPKVLDALRKEYRSSDITEEMWRDVKRIYYAMCAKVDALFGMVVDALVEQGLYDDTWIFFFSDHGDFAGDYSLPEKTHSTLQDCLVHVPLVIKPPASVPVQSGNRRHLTELLDITATIYDLLDIDPGYTYQGVSLRNSLAGAEDTLHEAVFAEVGGRKSEPGYFNTEVDLSGKGFYSRQSRAARPYTMAGTHAVMCRTLHHKYIRRCYTEHNELFDLMLDPGETRNVSGNPDYADVEREMSTTLLDFMLRTADVLPHEGDSRKIL